MRTDLELQHHRVERALEQVDIETMKGVSRMWSAEDDPALGLPAPAAHPQVAEVIVLGPVEGSVVEQALA